MKMNRFLLCISLVLAWSRLAYGQITYTAVFIDKCTNEVTDAYWCLKGSENFYFPEMNDLKTVDIPSAGSYLLTFTLKYDEDPIEIVINNNQSRTDTFYISRLRFNPGVGYSYYTECDSLANGHLISYYPHGATKMIGTFKEGQVSDSLREFYQSGELKEVFIPHEKGWRRVKYYKDGKIKTEYDLQKRFIKEFYPNERLKLITKWTKGHPSRTRKYFMNGEPELIQKNKSLVKYNEAGIVVQKMKRKEIFELHRIFSRKARYRYQIFYNYEWESFDETGVVKRKIIFHDDGFLTGPFPDSVQQIEDYSFEKVIFYRNGQEFKKMESEYVWENDELMKKLILYQKEQKHWIEERTTTADKVYEIIAHY